jgi:hypothetical protein
MKPLLAACAAAAFLHLVALPAAAAPTSEQEAQAQQLVDKAFGEHAAGKDVEAVGTYLKAYEISKVAPILYNVATIYDRHLHERALAIEYFRRYIESPDAISEFVQKATDRITAIKRELAAEDQKHMAQLAAQPREAPTDAPAAVTPPPSAPPAQSGWSGWKSAGVVVGAVGLAGVATSFGLGAVAKNKSDGANAVCGPSTCGTPAGVSLEHQAVDFATAATATFVVGAVLLAAGVTTIIVAPSDSARPRPASAQFVVVPQIGANGGGLGVYTRF